MKFIKDLTALCEIFISLIFVSVQQKKSFQQRIQDMVRGPREIFRSEPILARIWDSEPQTPGAPPGSTSARMFK